VRHAAQRLRWKQALRQARSFEIVMMSWNFDCVTRCYEMS
jgi:hypothetical protein